MVMSVTLAQANEIDEFRRNDPFCSNGIYSVENYVNGIVSL